MTAPSMITRAGPKRSAMAPANGNAMPHRRFCNAIARAKVSLGQSLATVMGSRNSPKTERTPKPMLEMAQPAMMTISTFRQGIGGRFVGAFMGDLWAIYERFMEVVVAAITHHFRAGHPRNFFVEEVLSGKFSRSH